MLGQNFVDLIYGFIWNDLTWKEPYKNMEPEEVFRKIEDSSATVKDEEGNLFSIMTLLYNPDAEEFYVGVKPGYTREGVYFDVWEQVVEYVVNSIAPFVEEDKLKLGSWADEYVVYTG